MAFIPASAAWCNSKTKMNDFWLDYKPTRLEVLQEYQIMDTLPEAVFDQLTQLAAQICQTPVALITFVDADRQWFKSRAGADMIEAPLDSGFCPFVVEKGDSLVIADTLADEQFASNPVVVSPPHVRFYAGMPLVTSQGYVLGTLCVLDYVPRQLSSEQINALLILSRQVMTQLEAQYATRKVVQTDTALIEVTQGVSASIGEAFFYSLVEHISKALQVDYAYVSQLAENNEIAQTIAVYAHGQIAENLQYSLRTTPCGHVIEQRKICCYPRGVQALFPQAYLLREMEVESYVAVPLFDSTGASLGVLGVMARKPLDKVQLTESLLSIFGTRAATELERQLSELERAQLLLCEQQSRKQAEEANRLKDEFLAVLSHELRTPLNPILGWTQLLRSRKLDEKATDQALLVIERNAKLQTQLIEDLLDVSSILRGKLNLQVSPVDLASVIEQAIETVRLAAQAKSIDLSCAILVARLGDDTENLAYIHTDKQPDHPKSAFRPRSLGTSQNHATSLKSGNPPTRVAPKFLVLGDSGRLVQVVWNLLSNAVKFTPSGGRVEVRLERVGTYAQIQVSDTGRGIDPEFLPYVFDYFRQADGTTTRQFGGLGLGLAIVRHLVELHGGTVHAASPGEDKGATFVVQLPLLTAPEFQVLTPESSIRNSTQDVLSGVRILVVDDEADMREFVAFVLSEYGAVCTVRASALEALQVLTKEQPDLLLSDIGMPHMDGYMLMRQVRQRFPQGRQIPAIALTAYAGEVNQLQALQAGFQLHISKPIEPMVLVQAISSLLKTKKLDE